MAVVPVTAIPKTGLINPAGTTPAATDRVAPGSMLLVRNGNAAGCVVTILSMDTADGDLTVSDRAQTSIPATTGLGVIRVPNSPVYTDPADGLVAVSFSVQTSVTYTVLAP